MCPKIGICLTQMICSCLDAPAPGKQSLGTGRSIAQHLHDRSDQSLALTESQSKHRPQSQYPSYSLNRADWLSECEASGLHTQPDCSRSHRFSGSWPKRSCQTRCTANLGASTLRIIVIGRAEARRARRDQPALGIVRVGAVCDISKMKGCGFEAAARSLPHAGHKNREPFQIEARINYRQIIFDKI
jgi:hypothetical protein